MKVWKKSASIKTIQIYVLHVPLSMSICKSIAHVWIWNLKKNDYIYLIFIGFISYLIGINFLFHVLCKRTGISFQVSRDLK